MSVSVIICKYVEIGGVKVIEKYVEKDIMRQIKVMEYLFELKRIHIQEIANLLEVSKVTIKRDIEKILFIESRIKVISETSTIIEVQFWKNATRYELIKKIYYQSHFLRVCSLYLMGQNNYMKIVEKEHISIAKAFNLKKQVEDFFITTGIMNESKVFIEDELKKRIIILTIWMRIDTFNQIIDQKLFYEAEDIVRKFIKEFSNTLNTRELYFFRFAIYLSLKRQNNHLNIPKREIQYTKRGMLYPKIKKILANYQLNDNEVIYIAMMYRLLNQNLHNYQHLVIDYEYLRKVYIDDIPEMLELIHIFELHFDRVLLKDIMFEKPFLRFIISTFLDRQMFLVEKHYFLGEQQRYLYQEIEKIITKWSDKYSIDIHLSRRTTEKFCLQVSELLLHNSSKKWNVFIVAEDEYSHVAYREWIKRKMNTTHIIIDSVLYYSLDSLPVYINADSSIIICERTIMNYPTESIRNTKTFPISLFSINKDMKHFFSYVFS